MSALYNLFRTLDSVWPAKIARAHCDVPCGIYDPHISQLAAHTVVRMVKLISELPKEQGSESGHKLVRYTLVKEEHAELCKKELRILWGDYFKPEHVQKFPELHELMFKAMKLASKARQETSIQAADDLLNIVNNIAEIFWKTKGIETVRKKSFYPTEKETVYPKL